jgi:hypothetical protein
VTALRPADRLRALADYPMPSPDDLSGAIDPIPRDGATTAVDARSNGLGHGEAHGRGRRSKPPLSEPPRRRPPGPSTKPALIVLGLTTLLFVLGAGLEVLSGHQSRPTPVPTSIVTARGAALHAIPARPLLKSITSIGEPPDDLLNALAVPKGATPVPSSATNRGVELYDRSMRFEVPATQQDVITFFRVELPALHWHQLSQGPATNVRAYQILEQHPASDGRQWEIGVTVEPTFFDGSSSASGTSVPSTGTTSFTLRLFAVADQN